MSDSISIPNFPAQELVPGLFFSLDASNANTAQQDQRTLIIGQMLSAGTYTPDVPVQIVGYPDVVANSGGPNSMLAIEVARYMRSDPEGEIWVLPLADDGAATKTVVTATVTGTATAAGALYLMVAGQSVTVPIPSGTLGSATGTLIAQAAALVPTLPAVVTSAAGVATLTAVHGGIAGGKLDVRQNYYGTAGGQQTCPGLAVAFATTTSGAGNPVTGLTAGVANLGTMPFDFIVCPYTDTPSLNLMDALLDPTTGRWSWEEQIYGGVFTALNGTVSARDTFSSARDDKFVTAIGAANVPNPDYEWAADYAGACAFSLRSDPALPLGGVGDGVPLTVLPPPVAYQDTFQEQTVLLTGGFSTVFNEPGGAMRVQRAVNIYTTNPSGQPDNSYQDVETTYTLMAVLRQLRIQMSSQFGRKKLVADGTPIAGGSNFVTSQTVLQTVIAIYRTMALNGLVQNASTFATSARAQNAGNGIVRLYLPIMIANQLRVIAGDVAFSKP